MLPAARNAEQCFCPAHGVGAINKSAAGSVETNSRGQARGGDSAVCPCGPIDFLVTGSGSVTVNSQPAARTSDKTMHHGLVMLGSGDVVIGGPTVGATLGNLGLAYTDLGDVRKAIEFHEQALLIHREIGNRRGEGIALWNLALAREKLGDRSQAITCAEASLTIQEEIEYPFAPKVREQLAEWRS